MPSSTWFVSRKNDRTGWRYSIMVSFTPFSSRYPSVSTSVFSFPSTASMEVCRKRRLTSTEPCEGGRWRRESIIKRFTWMKCLSYTITKPCMCLLYIQNDGIWWPSVSYAYKDMAQCQIWCCYTNPCTIFRIKRSP